MYKPCLVIVCMLICTLIFSCYDENSTFGQKLVESDFRRLVSDTNTVTVTIKKIDSVETSGKGVALVGHYTHPIWGTVHATSYVPYSRPSYSTSVTQRVGFDSITLKLNYASYYIGDTLLPYKISVHPLTEKVKLDKNGYLYNTNTIPYEEEPIIEHTFWPRPTGKESIEIRLPDELGEEMLTAFHKRDEAVSVERWDDFFKGIALISDETVNQSLFSFGLGDTLSCIVLYYHIRGDVNQAQQLRITPNTTTQFNNFYMDATGTILEPYNDVPKVEIPSEEVINRGLLFGGVGWYCRLDFPYLNNINRQGSKVEIDQATLKIYPEYGTYSDFNILPDSIFLYIADENNVVSNVVTDYLGSEVQIAQLNRDNAFPHNTHFTFDLTDFLQQELGAFGVYKHNLQMVFGSEDYTNTFKNLTFFDKNGESPLKLEITYTVYESNY